VFLDKHRSSLYLVAMHPVRKALNAWKAANPGKTDSDFAAHVGYSDADAIYKQIRGEYIAPHDKLAVMAKVLNWSTGRFLDACSKLRRAS
jgi:REP element-mobilizing transposase RayT